MDLDQVLEQNNRAIKSCDSETDLVNKVEDSARIISEFEESKAKNA